MSEDEEIELELDDVFPAPGSRSEIVTKPPRPIPRRVLPPPPPLPQVAGAMERLQEDVDLVIDATSTRLDAMERSQTELEHTLRGVTGAQERRIRELEGRMERTQHFMLELTRKLRDVRDLLDEHQHGIDEVRARNTIAVAKIEQIHASSQPALLESDLRAWRDLAEEGSDSEPTMRVVRR